jgi:hypothetical protein
MTALRWSGAAVIDLRTDVDGGWRARAEAMEKDLLRWHQAGMLDQAAIMVNQIAEDADLLLAWSGRHKGFTEATAHAVHRVAQHLNAVHVGLIASAGRKKVRR